VKCTIESASNPRESDNMMILAEEPWSWAGMTTLGFAVMLGSHAAVVALVESGVTMADNSMGRVLQDGFNELMACAYLGRFSLMQYLWVRSVLRMFCPLVILVTERS